MPCLAASRLPFQVPSVGGAGGSGVGASAQRTLGCPRVLEFLATGRSSPVRSSVRARCAVENKVSFIGAAPEGAESSGCGGLWSSHPGLSVRLRERFARLGSAACAPWLAKAHSSRSRRPVACSAAFSTVLQVPGPNHSVNRTPCQLRWQVPSGLRPPVAGYLKRWAS